MTDKCIWEPEENSSRAWWMGRYHPDEDSEPREIQHVWRFCPYCGKEIDFVTPVDGETKS